MVTTKKLREARRIITELIDNSIKAVGARELSEGLKINTTLTVLNLGGCRDNQIR